MSIVKRGAYGLGAGAYGQSKPVLNYHTQSSDSATTVVTEINRLTVNEKHASMKEVCVVDPGAYPYNHGGAVVDTGGYQPYAYQHGYGGQMPYQDGSNVVGGYGHNSTGQTHGHAGQMAYPNGTGAGGYSTPGYGQQKAHEHGSNVVGGYGHHDYSATQKHEGYGGQKPCQNGCNGYGEQKTNQQGCAVGGYGAPVQGGGNKTTYDGVRGFDALVRANEMQKQRQGEHDACNPRGDVAGFDALVRAKNEGYGHQQEYGNGADVGGHALGHGAVHHNQVQATYGNTYTQQVPGGHHGGTQTRQYKQACDTQEEMGHTGEFAASGANMTYNFESYENTTTQGYSSGGHGGRA